MSKAQVYTVVIIGGGTIGEILVKGCVALCGTNHVSVVEHRPERAEELRTIYGITAGAADDTAWLGNVVTGADVVMLAVKPQDFAGAAADIQPYLRQQLIVSVMAGIGIAKLRAALRVDKIIRTMPNTPAKIGQGMTVWTHTETVSESEQQFIRQLLRSFGDELKLDSDDDIDKATAVNGSGPAYVFLFAEQLMVAAQRLGFTHDQAEQLIKQTMLGSAGLLANAMESAGELRAHVTSKGGTTEAALRSLPQEEMQKMWEKAVRAAYQRARELQNE